MRKILRVLLSFLLILISFFPAAPQAEAAADCGSVTPPSIIEAQQGDEIPFTLQTEFTNPGSIYKVKFAGGVIEGGPLGTGQHEYTNITADASTGSLSWTKQSHQRYDTDDNNARFIVYDSSNKTICEEKLNVGYISCTINIEQAAPKLGEELTFNVSGLINRGGEYHLAFWRGENSEESLILRRVPDSQLVNNASYSLGVLEGGGHHLIQIRDRAAPLGDNYAIDAQLLCERGFTATRDGGTIDEPTSSPYSKIALKLPCGNDETETCDEINTGVGTIDTDPEGFVRWLLTFILSLAGGIVVLIVIATGYRLMSSQGDPEKVKEAREQLTAAIVGLLFIIFSLVILQTIAVDIFHIPGFG